MEFRVFVSATDTGVGKTVVCGGLLKAALAQARSIRYWKPVQTGTDFDDDTQEIASITKCPPHCLETPAFRFKTPVSPHLAAEREGQTIDRITLTKVAAAVLERQGDVIVEGAGGLMVPLAPGYLQIDFIADLQLPVLLVAHDKLGGINHTLLSLEVCRHRGISVMGVILNRAGELEGNADAIARYGGIKVLARFPEQADAATALDEIAQRCGREFFS